jgi:hypothetical protein
MTHRDRAGDASGQRAGQRAGRREAVGDAGHHQGFPTPPPIRPLPVRLRDRNGGFPRHSGGPWLFRWGTRLPMSRIAAPWAPGRKPWETVSMGHYQRSLVLAREGFGRGSRAVMMSRLERPDPPPPPP